MHVHAWFSLQCFQVVYGVCMRACVPRHQVPLTFSFSCRYVSFSVHSNVHRGEHKMCVCCVCVCCDCVVCVCVCVCVWIREMRNEQCLLKMSTPHPPCFGGGGCHFHATSHNRARERERAGVYMHIYVHTVCEDAGTKGVCVRARVCTCRGKRKARLGAGERGSRQGSEYQSFCHNYSNL